MANLGAFHEYMVAVEPTTVSVSIPDENDRATWVVQCEPPLEETDPRQPGIDAAIQAYNINSLTSDEERMVTFLVEPNQISVVSVLDSGDPKQVDAWLADIKGIPDLIQKLGDLAKALCFTPTVPGLSGEKLQSLVAMARQRQQGKQ